MTKNKSVRKNPVIVFLITFVVLNILPLPVYPCFTRVIIIPIEPYRLNFCPGYLFYSPLFGKNPGSHTIIYPAVLTALVLSFIITFLITRIKK